MDRDGKGLGRWSELRAAVVMTALTTFTPALAAGSAQGPGCVGIFLRDVQAFAVVETGDLEPTGDRRKAGDRRRFTGSDRFEGVLYYELEGSYFYPARGIKIASGCRLGRLR